MRTPKLLLPAVAALALAACATVEAFVLPLPQRTAPLASPAASRVLAGGRASHAALVGPLPWRRRAAQPTALAALGPEHVYLAADIKKIVSDEIYGPMFFQAMLLSVSGFLAAAALAAVIIFKGDALTTELLEEAYQERDTLRERLDATEDADGTLMVGFQGKAKPAAAEQPAKAPAAAPAAAAQEKEKELVGAGSSSGSSSAPAVNDFED